MSRSDGSILVECSGVEKSYGHGAAATRALDGVDLVLTCGEFAVLAGPSGSGKSTLLNLIAGLDVPSRGRIVVEGRELSTMTDDELADMRFATVGFVFQAFNLLPALTVADNLALPLKFAGVHAQEIRERVRKALDRVGVAGLAQRYPAEISGGEQQRVAIARAFIARPSLLLADEPTGSLDSRAGRDVLDLLKALNAAEAVTILMVTHDAVAAGYGHRRIELRDGRIWRETGRQSSQGGTSEPRR